MNQFGKFDKTPSQGDPGGIVIPSSQESQDQQMVQQDKKKSGHGGSRSSRKKSPSKSRESSRNKDNSSKTGGSSKKSSSKSSGSGKSPTSKSGGSSKSTKQYSTDKTPTAKAKGLGGSSSGSSSGNSGGNSGDRPKSDGKDQGTQSNRVRIQEPASQKEKTVPETQVESTDDTSNEDFDSDGNFKRRNSGNNGNNFNTFNGRKMVSPVEAQMEEISKRYPRFVINHEFERMIADGLSREEVYTQLEESISLYDIEAFDNYAAERATMVNVISDDMKEYFKELKRDKLCAHFKEVGGNLQKAEDDLRDYAAFEANPDHGKFRLLSDTYDAIRKEYLEVGAKRATLSEDPVSVLVEGMTSRQLRYNIRSGMTLWQQCNPRPFRQVKKRPRSKKSQKQHQQQQQKKTQLPQSTLEPKVRQKQQKKSSPEMFEDIRTKLQEQKGKDLTREEAEYLLSRLGPLDEKASKINNERGYSEAVEAKDEIEELFDDGIESDEMEQEPPAKRRRLNGSTTENRFKKAAKQSKEQVLLYIPIFVRVCVSLDWFECDLAGLFLNNSMTSNHLALV